MSTWVLPAGSNEFDGAHDGDLLVRAEGDEVHVARVVGHAVEWLGGAPVATIVLPDVDTPTAAPPELAEDLEVFADLLAARGG